MPPLRDKGARLHDVDFSAHIDPFDVLIFTAKYALNTPRCSYESANDVVGQYCAPTGNGNLFDSAFFIKRQQTVFSRPGQHLDSVGFAVEI